MALRDPGVAGWRARSPAGASPAGPSQDRMTHAAGSGADKESFQERMPSFPQGWLLFLKVSKVRKECLIADSVKRTVLVWYWNGVNP